MKPLKPGQAPRTKFLVKELLYVPRTVYRILTRTMNPIKGRESSHEEIVGIMKNLLFNIMHDISINYHDFFIRTLANVHFLRLSWSLMLLGLWDSSGQGLHSTKKLIFIINSATCPQLKSSSRPIPQLMKRARHQLLSMKVFVHWMASSAKLHLTPLMMTLPLMTLPPMLQSNILKP